MADNKKSFIAYADWYDIFKELPDKEAGQLVKHLFSYVNDENPEAKSILIKASFATIKNTLKRDLKKWEKYIEKQSNNGKKGGRPKKEETQKNPNKAVGFLEKPNKAKKADSVSVNVSDSNNNKPQLSVEDTFNLFWDRYHELTGHPKNNKKPAFKYWKKLTLEQRRKAYEKIGLYAKTNETKYLKIARTYLADETFNDELVAANNSKEDTESPRMYVKNHLTYGQLIGKEPIRSDKYPEYNGLFYHQLKDEFLKPKNNNDEN